MKWVCWPALGSLLLLVGCAGNDTNESMSDRNQGQVRKYASAGEYRPELIYGVLPQYPSESEHLLVNQKATGNDQIVKEMDHAFKALEESPGPISDTPLTQNADTDQPQTTHSTQSNDLTPRGRDIWDEYCNQGKPLESFSDEERTTLSTQEPGDTKKYDCYMGKDAVWYSAKEGL